MKEKLFDYLSGEVPSPTALIHITPDAANRETSQQITEITFPGTSEPGPCLAQGSKSRIYGFGRTGWLLSACRSVLLSRTAVNPKAAA